MSDKYFSLSYRITCDKKFPPYQAKAKFIQSAATRAFRHSINHIDKVDEIGYRSCQQCLKSVLNKQQYINIFRL